MQVLRIPALTRDKLVIFSATTARVHPINERLFCGRCLTKAAVIISIEDRRSVYWRLERGAER